MSDIIIFNKGILWGFVTLRTRLVHHIRGMDLNVLDDKARVNSKPRVRLLSFVCWLSFVYSLLSEYVVKNLCQQMQEHQCVSQYLTLATKTRVKSYFSVEFYIQTFQAIMTSVHFHLGSPLVFVGNLRMPTEHLSSSFTQFPPSTFTIFLSSNMIVLLCDSKWPLICERWTNLKWCSMPIHLQKTIHFIC